MRRKNSNFKKKFTVGPNILSSGGGKNGCRNCKGEGRWFSIADKGYQRCPCVSGALVSPAKVVLTVSPEIKSLIGWRDRCSDHYGEDLIWTILDIGTRDIKTIPEEHHEAVREFRTYTEEDQYNIVLSVVGL